MMHAIAARAFDAFATDAGIQPALTLRAGSLIDSYAEPSAYDPPVDEPTDEYLADFAFEGLAYLDPPSWRHYLPCLIDYTLRHLGGPGGMALEGLLWSLRPPDRTPARLGSLTAEQEEVLADFLDFLAEVEGLPEGDLVLQVIEEWWMPGALYRPEPTDV